MSHLIAHDLRVRTLDVTSWIAGLAAAAARLFTRGHANAALASLVSCDRVGLLGVALDETRAGER